MEKKSLLSLLQRNIASSLGADACEVIYLTTSTPITNGFKALYDHKIHSAPVIDSKSNQYVAFLDYVDVISHLFSTFSDEELEHVKLPRITEWKGEYIQVIGEKEHYASHTGEIPDPKKIQQFASKTVGEVAKGTWVAISDKKTLYDALETMITKSSVERHIHRVGVQTEESHKLAKILTQSDLIKFLYRHISNFKEAANLTVAQLHLDKMHSEIVKIDKNSIALEGFKLMNQKHIEGMPVVDKQNRLVGNLSMSDMRLIMFNASELLYMYLSISEYMQKMHKRDTSLPEREISCTTSTTLHELLKMFVENMIHRVYIVDENHHLSGLITMGDVLKKVWSCKL